MSSRSPTQCLATPDGGRGTLQEADAWGARALELAERLDDTEALVYALTNIGSAELCAGVEPGRTGSSGRWRSRNSTASRIMPGGSSTARDVASAAPQARDEAERHLEAGLEYCRERGLDTWRLYLLAGRARLELDRGRWDAAADAAALVLRDPRSARRAARLGVGRRSGSPGAPRRRRGLAAAREADALAESTGELSGSGRSPPRARSWLGWAATPRRSKRVTDAALGAGDRPSRAVGRR